MLNALYDQFIQGFPLLVAYFDANGPQWMAAFQGAVPSKSPFDFLFKK